MCYTKKVIFIDWVIEMKKTLFEGVGTAIATPFNENGINYKEYDKLLENQLENNIDAIVVCGTTGEAATMSYEERSELVHHTIDRVDGKSKVIVGTGSNATQVAIRLSKEAEEAGADGLLVVTPYYNKATQDGLVKHYEVISDSVSLPIIVYSVSSRTGVNIKPETCLKLSKIGNVVAIKEASGNISQVAKIASLCGDDLDIYSGNDDQIVPVLSLGGKGVISVLSNIYPKYTKEMVESFQNGDIKKATKMQLDAIETIEALFSEVNPIPVKYALNELGYDFGKPRLPLTELTDENKVRMQKVLSKKL